MYSKGREGDTHPELPGEREAEGDTHPELKGEREAEG
jgi:hypothetical protein